MTNERTSRGRQKIEMKMITNESNLQVTFSKRYRGLYKKASELCTLCGVECALLIFSPTGKVLSFGNPNVDAMINRYAKGDPPQKSLTMQLIEAQRNANVRRLNAQITHQNNQLDVVRNRNEKLTRLRKVAQIQYWWASPINDMNKTQLEQLQAKLEELKKQMVRDDDRLVIQTPIDLANHPFLAGASSSSNPVLQPPPLPQVFTPQPHMFRPSVVQNQMFDGSMMSHHGFDIGGYRHCGFF